MWIRYTVLPVICLAAFLCCGCSQQNPRQSAPTESAETAVKLAYMESTPVVDYAVPQLTPNVLVCRAGYQTKGMRRAAVKGKQLPQSFRLVNADTGETVFSDMLENGEYNADLDIYVAYADFDGWTQEGNYYIECEYAGRSYPFTIDRELYKQRFDEVYREMIKGCEERTISISDVAEMLLAYEWYPDIFADEDSDKIPDALKKIAAWIDTTADGSVQAGQEAYYAAALAKFSYLYQQYDRQFATDCLKRASVVLEQSQGAMQKDAECFYALTELYRATGLEQYNIQIAEYRTYFENHTSFEEERSYLFGAMTYISTRQPVDVELCKLLLDRIMDQGEEISNIYKTMTHPVSARNNGTKDLLGHAADLACANYVMNNYQYNRVMEELAHYLCGKNQQSVNFYEERTPQAADEGYLLLFAQLAGVRDVLGK